MDKIDLFFWTNNAHPFQKNYHVLKKHIRDLDAECIEKPFSSPFRYVSIEKSDAKLGLELIDDVSKQIHNAEHPSLNVIMLGTSEAIEAAKQQKAQNAVVPCGDPSINDVIGMLTKTSMKDQPEQGNGEKTKPGHGILIIGPFPLNTPDQGEHPFSLEAYDQQAGEWAEDWNRITIENSSNNPFIILKALNPFQVFCDIGGGLSPLAHEKDGLTLTPGGVAYLFEHMMKEISIMRIRMQLAELQQKLFEGKSQCVDALKNLVSHAQPLKTDKEKSTTSKTSCDCFTKTCRKQVACD